MAPLHLQRILSQPQQLPSNAAPQEGGVTNCWYFYGVNYFARSQSIKKMFYRDLQKTDGFMKTKQKQNRWMKGARKEGLWILLNRENVRGGVKVIPLRISCKTIC